MPTITVAPGAIQIGWPDLAKTERTTERAATHGRRLAAELAEFHGAEDKRQAAEWESELDPDSMSEPDPSRVIEEWSRKSRANMRKSLAQLDMNPMFDLGFPVAMVTLTYPGDWMAVVPNAETLKAHMDAFRKRYERDWGIKIKAIWKKEFQRRGAPHLHFQLPIPTGVAGESVELEHEAKLLAWRERMAEWEAGGRQGRRPRRPGLRVGVGHGLRFKQWLSEVWTDIVDPPDPEERRRHLGAGTNVDEAEGMRSTDPKRLATYFAKHGAYADKEYQHVVPEEWQEPGRGPGRFWGYWGLAKATAGVHVPADAAVWAGRIMRRYARSRGGTQVLVEPYLDSDGSLRSRRIVKRQPVTAKRSVLRQSVDRRTGEVRERYRRANRRLGLFGNNRGFMVMNDAPEFAAKLSDFLWDVTGQTYVRQVELNDAGRVRGRARMMQQEMRKASARTPEGMRRSRTVGRAWVGKFGDWAAESPESVRALREAQEAEAEDRSGETTIGAES